MPTTRRLAFRHCDARFGFLWTATAQPAARWHGAGEGPANYFADTPVGAWAEFLRHEGITEPADLAGLQRSLWAVELPDEPAAEPVLPPAVLRGGRETHPACQAEARRLRAAGATALAAPSAALKAAGAAGWRTRALTIEPAPPGAAGDGCVIVLFGARDLIGWIAVDAGAPPAAVLPLVRGLDRA